MEKKLDALSQDFLSGLCASTGDRFQLISIIGEGKNGLALRTLMRDNAELYCLKTIHPETLTENRADAAIEKLKKEVAILTPLNHRCLPRIIFSDLKAKLPYYVCTYHPGKTFYDFRQQDRRLPTEQSMFVIYSIIDVFDYVHKNGRSHCDAHQDNILIGENVFSQGIMLIDFGSGHRLSDERPVTFDKGALEFKPPQFQPRHQQLINRAAAAKDFEQYDIRAVGMLLSVMREIFFSDASVQQVSEYDDFCSDLQNGTIKSWEDARGRLKFVADPSYIQSQLSRFYQTARGASAPLVIPASRAIRVGEAFGNLIASRTFQRLRGIKQLAFCDWVYPGAVHNRLEHSLGVLNVAIEGIDHLCSNTEFRRDFSEVQIASVLITALLHDIGHYPFAHVIEHYVAARFSGNAELRAHVSHTNYSKNLIEHDLHISKILKDHFSEDHIAETINILNGNRRFLSRILDSTIDFDKIDYLKRDSLHCGVAYGSGFDSSELLSSIRYIRPNESIYFSDEMSHAVEGFLILQSQMLSGVYWNEKIRVLFAMFHRFIDVCFANDLNAFKRFVHDLRATRGDFDAFSSVFRANYENYMRNKGKSLRKTLGLPQNDQLFDDPLWRLISIHLDPDPKLLYCCINRFRFTDETAHRSGARSNVFQSIIKASPGSTLSGGAIDWDQVKKLRTCYIATLREKKFDANLLDVLVDIPWGKGSSEPIKFVNRSGAERPIASVSHISSSIFTDLTIFAAPIRVFLSPMIHEFAKNDLESLNASALEKYFDPRGRFEAEAEP